MRPRACPKSKASRPARLRHLFHHCGGGGLPVFTQIDVARMVVRAAGIASHIKPWSACGDDTGSRGKRDNGLLLSSLWDAAFDSGLITFGKDWQVVTSDELSKSAREALKIKENIALPDRYRNSVRGEYLAYHRNNVFERWKKSAAAP